jgi:hypothetical protein
MDVHTQVADRRLIGVVMSPVKSYDHGIKPLAV